MENCFEELPESILVYIRYLENITQQQRVRIQEQDVRIQEQDFRIRELEARLSKTSVNSSKPPSSDGLKRKPKSLRKKTSKKPGGQPGRAGKGLSQISDPDNIVIHTPTNCSGCGSDLSDIEGTCIQKRQVIDIPEPKLSVTEHRVEEKTCPCCKEIVKGLFPKNVRGSVQYGERVRGLAAYFSHQHFIPVDRVCEIFEDIFGLSLSAGTCANIDEELFAHLEIFEFEFKSLSTFESSIAF